MKRLICILTAVMICMSFLPVSYTQAADMQADVLVEGARLSRQAYVEDGTSYIPVRDLCESLGLTVTWRTSDRSVLISGNGVYARLHVGFASAWDYSTEVQLGKACTLKSGTFYAPARGLAKLLELGIDWNGNKRQVLFQKSTAYTSDEVLWLARIINAEAQGESFDGQVAVGNVILNRVESPDFPNTIYGVIFDRNFGVQFTPTANGTIYNEPSQQCIEAAKLCLSGYEVAPNCLYFFNPQLSTAHHWIINNRTFYKIIGNHHFYD